MAGSSEKPKKMKRPGWAAKAAQADEGQKQPTPDAPTATLYRRAKKEQTPAAAGAGAHTNGATPPPTSHARTESTPPISETPPKKAQSARADGAAPGGSGGATKKVHDPLVLSEVWGKYAPNKRPSLALILGLVGLFIVVVFGFKACGWLGVGGPDETATSSSAPPPKSARQASGAVRHTDVAFSSLTRKGNTVSLKSAGLTWEGQVQSGEAGETITLKGPTAAQIRTGFELPRSNVTSGVFAVAQDNGPVLHVVYHTFSSGETEITQGSIFSIENNTLDQNGYYRDERDMGTQKVVRTYLVPGGKNYRVSFKAPEGTPIPLLVGYRGLG